MSTTIFCLGIDYTLAAGKHLNTSGGFTYHHDIRMRYLCVATHTRSMVSITVMQRWERRFFQWLWLPFYKIYALRYVRSNRIWRSHGMELAIPPGVFHPGVYFSTPLFLDFLAKIDFTGKSCLDVGTGSGALALFVAQKGAQSTAVDINPIAVKTAQKNALSMGLHVAVLQSDLFSALVHSGTFDYVLVNPPYYARDPENDAEHAFFAGENLTYFSRFFIEIQPFLRENSVIYMILSKDCDWHFIAQKATTTGFSSTIVKTWRLWGHELFVASIQLQKSH